VSSDSVESAQYSASVASTTRLGTKRKAAAAMHEKKLRGLGFADAQVRTHSPTHTALSLIPTVNGNTFRGFSTHGRLSAGQGSSTTVSRCDIIQLT
jgi:hypothetical protein